ncbi:MAG: asparaginase [Chloroflexi bacterium]|nr:asparaginase [Chloroflexota bacterium]MBU1751483.1 asparaginase [Chloroflexota bacterium]MBU1879504.1 asparaginase [Chloroflexota bacterium]
MTKRVYIAYTGGTVGMERTADGYAPAPGYLAARLAALPELRDPAMPAYTIHEYEPLLDSSNMTPDEWLRIARDIATHYTDYDGFVVLHGTDTMAYTASALAFMLQGLAKPVVITGSQIPLCELRNDARENLITAILVAAEYPIPEVCLCFGSRLLRGCRATKVSAAGLDAFASPNYPPLGAVGVDIKIDWGLVRSSAAGATLSVQALQTPAVGALRLFPGITAEVLRNILNPPLQGLVLEVYGVGNGPDRDPAFVAALQEATARGVVIVACTQCQEGEVRLGDYATGATLARAGVIGGADMTAEAALTKLFYLFSQGLGPAEVKREMSHDLRGELTDLQA